ncbi:MAG: translation initiation factor IF-3, partial [Proteobacteria bacterium]|nr:translation initiation factor IF-3 [Pseudomonadota bacterium]
MGLIFGLGYSGDYLIADNKQSRLNDDITAPEVRLIAEDGEQKGIISLEEAKNFAEAAKLDLVELVPD